MALKLPTPSFGISKDLLELIRTFNSVPEEDHIQRLFYLQKINYLLNTVTLNSALFAWLGNTEADGWLAHLNTYSINANASIFVKGIQFAQAIAKHNQDKPVLDTPVEDVYPLLQERDELLRSPSFENCKDRYIAVSCQLYALVDSDHRVKEIVRRHSEILFMAKRKLDSIQNRKPTLTDMPTPRYKTEELGGQVNNHNFRLEIEGMDDPFVFRVEDREKLGLEQDLHSFPVAKYFIEDYAVFMMEFIGEVQLIEYKPVVLSQFASGGNLANVAKSLRGTRDKDLGPIASHYFVQLGDFCNKLLEAKTFHPDIKLTNFLVHANLIRVSDRKTFIAEEHPTADTIRTTPIYAPDEFSACLNEDWTACNAAVASQTVMNMPQFMAYQLGMALKEFLILTQADKISDLDAFRAHDFNPAHYFKTTPNPIVNFSLLIQELTRPDPSKRLSIQQFKNLLKYRNLRPEQFYQKIEEELPSSTLGFQEDIDAVNTLLDGSFPEAEFLTRANVIFKKISTSQEPRLIRMAEKLATKCFQEYAESFFKQSIATALLDKDWEIAPWYRQLVHVLSFGYFRVDKVADLTDIQDTMGLDVGGEQFLSFFPHLEFLSPSDFDGLGKIEAEYVKNVIKQNVALIIADDSEEQSTENSTETSISTTEPLNVTPESKKSAPLNVTPSSKKMASLGGSKKASTSAPDQSHKSADNESSTSESSDWGTTVIDESKKDPIPLAQRFKFFAENDETPVKRKGAPNRVDSVRTSLFRGDGSHHKKPGQSRTTISEIDWDPLPKDPVDLKQSAVPQ